jgi:hypothetical protein
MRLAVSNRAAVSFTTPSRSPYRDRPMTHSAVSCGQTEPLW